MTNQQTSRSGALTVRTGIADRPIRHDCIEVGIPDEVSVVVETDDLLGMIDRAAPDAMRAYLRETAPEVIADLYRPEIPEADSPEDVDEHPDRDDPTERAQLDRAWALELAHRLFPHAGSLLAMKVAAWIIDGQQR